MKVSTKSALFVINALFGGEGDFIYMKMRGSYVVVTRAYAKRRIGSLRHIINKVRGGR